MPKPSPLSPSQRVFYPRALVNLAFSSGARFGASDLIKLEAVEPIELEVQCNDTASADTFSLTLDASLFPTDPTSLSAVVAEIFVGDVGSLGAQLVRDDRSRLILGHNDKMTLSFNNDKRPTVKLSGRDYTGFFLDNSWGTSVIERGKSVVDMVREVIALKPNTRALQVVAAFEGAAPVVPKGKGKKGAELTAKPDDKQWDVIQRIARAAGLIAVVKADKVILQPPRNIILGSPDNIPIFIDGYNLSSLSLERSFRLDNIPNVLVWARDPATGKRVTGTWPNPANSTIKIVKSDGKTERSKEVVYREFWGRAAEPTEANLSRIARGIWENFSQQQLKISFETKELYLHQQPYGGSIQEAGFGYPATAISNGSAVRLYIDRSIRSIVDKASSEDGRAEALLRANYATRVATALAKSWGELDKVFFVDSANHNFSQSSGYSLSVEAVNFIEVT